MISEVLIAQLIIGIIATFIIGATFLPLGATTASIEACKLNTDQKLVKFGGFVITVMASVSAILYLEVLRLNGLLSIG